MATQKKETKTGSKPPVAAPSPEFAAFEDLAKRVIRTPKTELDKREAEYKRRKDKDA